MGWQSSYIGCILKRSFHMRRPSVQIRQLLDGMPVSGRQEGISSQPSPLLPKLSWREERNLSVPRCACFVSGWKVQVSNPRKSDSPSLLLPPQGETAGEILETIYIMARGRKTHLFVWKSKWNEKAVKLFPAREGQWVLTSSHSPESADGCFLPPRN